MSEVKVNKLSPRSGTTVTIGDSGDTVNIVGTLQNNGSALTGDISSVVAGTGLSGGGTSGDVTINIEAAQPTITSLGTITGFTSTGIDDNANATAITIDTDENITFSGSSIARSVNDSVFGLSGGTATNVGGNITLYGGASGIPNAIKFRAAGTEVMRMTSDGLTFNGDTAAANALDDYEEGTWSPAISGTSGGASGVSFGDRFGSYVKIGKSVTVQVYINLDSWSSGPSGNLTVGTLPFTSSSTSAFRSSVAIGYTANFSQAPAGGIIANSATVINLKKFNSTSAQDNMTNNVTASDVSGDEVIMLTATYEV